MASSTQAGGSAPCDAETLFQAASISKPVNAALVLTLVDDGLLDLDADVNTYLRSWRVPAVDSWGSRALRCGAARRVAARV